ncbi:MAG: hypothetical protein HC881_24080, partial [Leptolyngbyaceae cyanobacterium SL_7_1]|nr:hypothetical protein [Leptolyngbyaceae cyanobacterium SL_7_1]
SQSTNQHPLPPAPSPPYPCSLCPSPACSASPSPPTDPVTPAPTGGTGDQDDLPEVGINSEAAPTSLTASIVGIASLPPDEAYDIPQVLPSPVSSTQSFTPDPSIRDPFDPNSCILDPESQRDLGQEVPLQLVIEPNGQVQQAVLRDQGSSLSLAYIELATCLVKTWQFNPAYNPTENGNEPVFSDHLIVRIVINSN